MYSVYSLYFVGTLFDSIKNEDKKDLNENIILYKLNKCNSWNDLLPQMQNYVNDFKQLV